MERCSLSDVMSAQAYILFYMQLDSSAPHVHSDNASTPPSPSINELVPQPGSSKDSKYSSTSREHLGQLEEADDEITFNFKNSSVPNFDRLQGGKKRKSNSEGGSRKLDVKRRKTVAW